jgi:N6-L-threonylcarbamoyladenine synthase
LRARVQALTKKRGVRLVLPPVSLCTDNGAMIAALGFHHLKEGRALSLDADAWSRWPNLKAVAVG